MAIRARNEGWRCDACGQIFSKCSPDLESLPSFDDSILNDADAWNQYQDEFNEAWAKIGKPQPKPLEMPLGVGMEPTLWERFCRRVRGELAYILRREGQIAAHRKIYLRVG